MRGSAEAILDDGSKDDDDDDLDAQLNDPVIRGYIERSVGPYRGLLSKDALKAMEDVLFMFLTTHPEVAPLVNRIRKTRAAERSGERIKSESSTGDRDASAGKESA